MKKIIKKIKNSKFLTALSVLIIVTFCVLIARITYAYFAPKFNSAQADIVVKSSTVDDFKLSIDDALKIDVTPTLLKENGSNYVDSTYATAKLKANNKNNTATYNYYLYFEVLNNTFNYSDGSTPEVILTITNPSGDIVTNIDGLTYGTYSGISGFDVTTKNGFFTISSTSITSNSSIEYTNEKWTITLTYLNLSIDQSSNIGKSMEVNLYMEKQARSLSSVTLASETISIDNTTASLVNMLGTYGNLDTAWSSCTVNTDSAYKKYGTGSCKLTGTTSDREILAVSPITLALDSTHTYYMRAEAYLAEGNVNSLYTGIYWPIAEPYFFEYYPVTLNSWKIVSAINTRSSFTSGSYNMRLDFDNNNTAGVIYFDGVVALDLTSSYGTSYPTQAYLDTLPFFTGTLNISTKNAPSTSATTFKTNATTSNSISCTNGASGTINENGIVSIIPNKSDTVCAII